jgi:hypothetical protein
MIAGDHLRTARSASEWRPGCPWFPWAPAGSLLADTLGRQPFESIDRKVFPEYVVANSAR